MGKIERCVEVCFDNIGTMPNGMRREIRVLLLKNSSRKNRKNPKKNRKKQKPSREERNGRAHHGKVYFKLQPGQRYRIEETVVKRKKRTAFRGCAIVAVAQNGDIRIEGWEGKFCPQFSSTREVIN